MNRMPVTGLVWDEDYKGFVNHVQIPLWPANSLLIAISVVSLAMAFVAGKHLWQIAKRKKQVFSHESGT